MTEMHTVRSGILDLAWRMGSAGYDILCVNK